MDDIQSVKTKMIKLDWQDKIALANMDALKEELVNMVRKREILEKTLLSLLQKNQTSFMMTDRTHAVWPLSL